MTENTRVRTYMIIVDIHTRVRARTRLLHHIHVHFKLLLRCVFTVVTMQTHDAPMVTLPACHVGATEG